MADGTSDLEELTTMLRAGLTKKQRGIVDGLSLLLSHPADKQPDVVEGLRPLLQHLTDGDIDKLLVCILDGNTDDTASLICGK